MDPLPRPVSRSDLTSSNPPVRNNANPTQIKQDSLDIFSELMDSDDPDDLADCHRLLQRGLTNPNYADQSPDHCDVMGLFKNRANSWYHRKCTESGSLALAAFAYKVFGEKILNPQLEFIDPQKLHLALQMLFGHDMPTIKNDLISAIYVSPEGILESKHYSIKVKLANSGFGGANAMTVKGLINSGTVGQTFFQKIKWAELEDIFQSEANVPAIFDQCHYEYFQGQKTAAKSARHDELVIEKDTEWHSSSIVSKLGFGSVTNTIAITSPIASKPTFLKNTIKIWRQEQPTITATECHCCAPKVTWGTCDRQVLFWKEKMKWHPNRGKKFRPAFTGQHTGWI